GAVPALIYTLSPAVTPTTNPTCTTAATSSSPAGSYPITCSGAALSGYTFSYTPGTLTVTGATPTFTLSVSPSSLSLAQDASTTDTITVTSQGGFNSSVALTIAGMPTPFATPKFTPSSVTPAANGSITSSLSLEPKGSTAPGTYTLTVTGKSGPTVVSVPITLTVTAK
ncbi:MAG: MBG domain-containing protein, partial [Terracidiphilus sp.]